MLYQLSHTPMNLFSRCKGRPGPVMSRGRPLKVLSALTSGNPASGRPHCAGSGPRRPWSHPSARRTRPCGTATNATSLASGLTRGLLGRCWIERSGAGGPRASILWDMPSDRSAPRVGLIEPYPDMGVRSRVFSKIPEDRSMLLEPGDQAQVLLDLELAHRVLGRQHRGEWHRVGPQPLDPSQHDALGVGPVAQ